jgi:hypothetical protein
VPRIPTQQWCLEQDDPKKRHQWLFVASMVYGSARYTPDDDSLEEMSERVHDTGYMHVSELTALADGNGNINVSQLRPQVKKMRLPSMGQHHTLNNTSSWVDMDEPDAVAMVAQDMDVFTTEQNQVHFQQLVEKGFKVPDPEPGPAEASVVTDLPKTFNPNDHSPSVVIGYLMGQDDTERRRVVAAEMRGSRKSDKILNHPDWNGL